MMNSGKRGTNEKQSNLLLFSRPLLGEALMKSFVMSGLVILVLTSISFAKEPFPDAPSEVMAASEFVEAPPVPVTSTAPTLAEGKTINATFLSLAVVSTGSSFADSYTTLFARENWLAGKTNVCNMEVESAYLYGTHPTVGRAYAVASVKSAGSLVAAYYLRRHHSKFWSLPLVANSVIGLQGVTQNMRACN
jgi:hypothetical protein